MNIDTRTKNCVRSILLGLGLSLMTLPAFAHDHYYERFGGKPGIKAVVNSFIGYVIADHRISGYFAHTDIPALKAALTDQFCQEEGGPCKYNGPSMSQVHQSLGVTEGAFNALVADLIKGMDHQHIPLAAQNNLLSKLAPMESQIVTR